MAEILPVVILGAGGHAMVIWDLLECLERYQVLGFTDPSIKPGTPKVLGTSTVHILGDDKVLSHCLVKEAKLLLIAGVGPEPSHVRQAVIRTIESYGPERTFAAVHPHAAIAKSAKIGRGTVIMAGAVINPGAVIGVHCVINTGATIDHECHLANNVFVQPGVHLGGKVVIEEGAVIGIGASIRENVHVGRNAYVGGGAFVNRDAPDDAIVAGVPAKLLRYRSARFGQEQGVYGN